MWGTGKNHVYCNLNTVLLFKNFCYYSYTEILKYTTFLIIIFMGVNHLLEIQNISWKNIDSDLLNCTAHTTFYNLHIFARMFLLIICFKFFSI